MNEVLSINPYNEQTYLDIIKYKDLEIGNKDH